MSVVGGVGWWCGWWCGFAGGVVGGVGCECGWWYPGVRISRKGWSSQLVLRCSGAHGSKRRGPYMQINWCRYADCRYSCQNLN